MKNLKSWINLIEAKTDATTFFHEVICGIACFDPLGAATIEKGADVKRFFDDGTIEAVNAGLSVIPPENLKQFKFMDDTVDVDGNLTSKSAGEDFWIKNKLGQRADDAISLARIIRENLDPRVGTPKNLYCGQDQPMMGLFMEPQILHIMNKEYL